MSGVAQAKTAWRFFPWFVAGAMALVVAVNVGMAYLAIHTFPGTVEKSAGEQGIAATAPKRPAPR